ncbi:hypothetical protein AAVH_20876 [Aphelenchoides avenae]|nr:hypothetical protein AAVH_20876 [Aphelenchus avenae]
MLPTEAFSDAIAFLRLFDLGALLVANSVVSSIALKASTAIRWEQFPGLKLYIAQRWIDIGRIPSPDDRDGQYRWNRVAMLIFRSVDETAEFIAAAFPNSIFDVVVFSSFISMPLASKPLVDAMDRVWDSVIVTGALNLPYAMGLDDALILVRKFRKVKPLGALRAPRV